LGGVALRWFIVCCLLFGVLAVYCLLFIVWRLFFIKPFEPIERVEPFKQNLI
jgi:hypothetical protein